MTTTEIMMAFNNTVSDNNTYTITELKKILTEVYNLKTKTKKDKKEDKVKKEPTPYNIFVKEHYSDFKTKNPTASSTEIMKMIADLWKNKDTDKQKVDNDKNKVDIVNNDPDVIQKVVVDDKKVDDKKDTNVNNDPDVKQKVVEDDKKNEEVKKEIKKTVKKVKKDTTIVDNDVKKEDVVDGDLPDIDKPKKRTIKK